MATSTPEESRKRVQAALETTRILRPSSYWESSKGRFTAAKIDALKSIVRLAKPDITDFDLDDLLARTAVAIEFFLAAMPDRKHDQKRHTKVLDELTELRETAVPFLHAWLKIQSDHHLLRVAGLQFEGRLGLPPWQPPAKSSEQARMRVEAMMRRRNQMARIESVLDDDLPQFLAELGPIIAALGKARRHRNPLEYSCVCSIAVAWMENVGEIATISRNTDAVSGPQQTDFQSYFTAAVPRGLIGPRILRDTIDSLRSAPWGHD